MATIAEQLESLTQIDPLDNREENPLGAPWVKGAWAASIGRLIGGFGYCPLTNGTENVGVNSEYQMKLAKDWAVAVRRGPQFADVVGASLQIWMRNRNAEKHGLRLIATRTSANIYTFKIEFWFNGELLETFGEESIGMAVGGSFALVLTEAKGEETFEPGRLSIWVEQEEGSGWEQFTEVEIEPIYLIELGEEAKYIGIGVSGASGSFSPTLADIRSAQLEEEEPEPPGVITSAASLISKFSARLNGFVDPNGEPTEYHFEYGTTEALGTSTSKKSAGEGDGNVFVLHDLSGSLSEGTKYFFRLVATNAAGTTNGAILNFTTLKAEAPVAVTGVADDIKPRSATLNGTVDPNLSSTDYYFEYGKTVAYGTKIPITGEGDAGEGGAAVAVDEAIASLDPLTEYHYRLVAKNAKGESLGADKTFVTAALPPVAVLREPPPDDIAAEVRVGGQLVQRWGPDEPSPDDILSDASIGTEMPGGYQTFRGTLARDPQRDWRDIKEYAELIAYRRGCDPVFEGSLDKGAKQSGEGRSISPEALGFQAILNDDNAVSAGYIDSDLSRWGEPSTQRRLNMIGSGQNYAADSSVAFQDKGEAGAALFFDFASVVDPNNPIAELWYYGEGIDIGSVRCDYHGDATSPWENVLALSTDDILSSFDTSGNFSGITTALNTFVNATVAGRKYARWKIRYESSFAGKMTNKFYINNTKVIGKHGLALQGTWPNVGFTAKQMLVHFINTYCAPLFTTDDFVDDDGFIIPQAWYPGMNRADIVKEIVKFGLFDWFCYNRYLLEHRRPGSYGRFWKALTVPSGLDEVGIDSQRLWRSITVQFTDPDGRTVRVGPPGSGANVETAKLEITDPDHPAVLAGRTRNDILDLRGVGSVEVAIEVGRRFLEEANLLNRSGSAKLSGFVEDHASVLWPVSVVKAGDMIAFTDSSDVSYRKIVRTDYSHRSRENEIDLDAPPSSLEALLERLQVVLIPLGVAA